MKTLPDLKTLLKDNVVQFSRYRKGHLFYTITDTQPMWDGPRRPGGLVDTALIHTYEFPVPIEDCGDATFPAHEKAILFMRYIRKAQEEGSFVRV